MRVLKLGIFSAVILVAACDLQPKISSIPDSVGDFISERYPALLADPDTEPEIYNSAVTDYGIYASPDLYGSDGLDDYVNYVSADDYVLKTEPGVEKVEQVEPVKAPEKETEKPEPQEKEPDDTLNIPEYRIDSLNVPAHAEVGTVVVRRGDTLYAIARENNTSVDVLARANGLKPPYTLFIGQKLKLAEPEKVEVKKEEPKAEQPKVEKPKAETQAVAPAKAEVKTETKKPVEQPRDEKPTKMDAQTSGTQVITVARGDTLYSLSRTYAVPVNDLAVMNGLTAPFALNAGQQIRVPAGRKPVAMPVAEPKKVVEAPVKKATEKSTEAKQTKTEAKQTKVETKPAVKETPKVTVKETPKATPKETPKTATDKSVKNKTTDKKTNTKTPEKKTEAKAETKSTKISSDPNKELPKIAARSSSKFTWPIRGKILSHYGAKSGGLYNDGINIAGTLNANVVAAENGVVAYAGNEVKGMGNLIIMQHADGWMTVYGHLNSMSVRRGARVTVGQKIGTVGKTGRVTSPQVHFEIRKGKKAYNPVNYLKK